MGQHSPLMRLLGPKMMFQNDSRVVRTVASACLWPLIVLIVLLGFHQYVPLQDYQEWIFQSHVFNGLLMGQQSDVAVLRHYPVPYAVSQIIISALLVGFSPFHASKIFIALYVSLAVLTMTVLVLRQRLLPGAAFLLVSGLVLGSCFWSGYVGYQLGLISLAVYAMLPREKQVASGVVLVFSTLCFFTHGVTFFVFSLWSAIVCLMARHPMRWMASMVPASLLVLSYLLFKTGHQTAGTNPVVLHGLSEHLIYKGYTLAKLGGYQNLIVNGIGDQYLSPLMPKAGLAANVLYAVCWIGAAVWVCFRAVAKRSISAEAWLFMVLLVLFLACPSFMLGIVNPGERLLFPASLILVCLLMRDTSGAARQWSWALGASMLAGLLISFMGLVAVPHKSNLAAAGAVGHAMPTGMSRVPFSHDLMRFSAKMDASQRAWHRGELPADEISFETSLLGRK